MKVSYIIEDGLVCWLPGSIVDLGRLMIENLIFGV
jgi:hypothetical protein